MLGPSGPADAYQAYVTQLNATVAVPQSVKDLVTTIQTMFFIRAPWKLTLLTDPLRLKSASAFAFAPPIWQELDFKACADGSIKQISNIPILRSSWMPDQYLYHNGHAMNLAGAGTGSAMPIVKGNFYNFSAIPDPNNDYPLWPNAYGPCGPATGQSGNPWNLSAADLTQVPDQDPAQAHFCVDSTISPDPNYSG